MPPFKIKFTAHPQHDAEGFTVMDAKCRGCTPDEMCPRSGHCERYESALRGVLDRYTDRLVEDFNLAADKQIDTVLANAGVDGINWCEPCTSYHHPDAPGCFAKSEPVKLSEMTDAELNEAHEDWLRRGRAE